MLWRSFFLCSISCAWFTVPIHDWKGRFSVFSDHVAVFWGWFGWLFDRFRMISARNSNIQSWTNIKKRIQAARNRLKIGGKCLFLLCHGRGGRCGRFTRMIHAEQSHGHPRWECVRVHAVLLLRLVGGLLQLIAIKQRAGNQGRYNGGRCDQDE